jgi:hypothetical protein
MRKAVGIFFSFRDPDLWRGNLAKGFDADTASVDHMSLLSLSVEEDADMYS